MSTRKLGKQEVISKAKASGDWKEKEIIQGFYVSKTRPPKASSDLITLVGLGPKGPSDKIIDLWLAGSMRKAFEDETCVPGLLLQLTCTGFYQRNGRTCPAIDVEVVTDKNSRDVKFDVEKLKKIVAANKEQPKEEEKWEVELEE